jgi:hypothetical protein
MTLQIAVEIHSLGLFLVISLIVAVGPAWFLQPSRLMAAVSVVVAADGAGLVTELNRAGHGKTERRARSAAKISKLERNLSHWGRAA